MIGRNGPMSGHGGHPLVEQDALLAFLKLQGDVEFLPGLFFAQSYLDGNRELP